MLGPASQNSKRQAVGLVSGLALIHRAPTGVGQKNGPRQTQVHTVNGTTTGIHLCIELENDLFFSRSVTYGSIPSKRHVGMFLVCVVSYFVER